MKALKARIQKVVFNIEWKEVEIFEMHGISDANIYYVQI